MSRRHVGTTAARTASPRAAVTVSGFAPAATGIARSPAPATVVGRDADPIEEGPLVGARQRRPEEPVHPSRPECDPARRGLVRGAVDPAGRDGATGPLGDQARRAVGADPGEADLLALLEAEAGLRSQPIALARPADLIGSKIADSTITSVVASADLRRGAAHDPGDPERPAGIGDQERVGVQRPLDVIERLEPLARGRASDDELRPSLGTAVGVERMDRLAELEHDVVADVDDVADRAACPAARSRIWTRSGDGPTVTPSTQRPTNRGHNVRVADLDASSDRRRRGRPRLDRSAASGAARR